MSKKVYIELKVPIVVRIDEGVELSELMNQATVNVKLETDSADLEDVGPVKYEVIDSK